MILYLPSDTCYPVTVADHISIQQELQTETLGQCTDFKAVPGHGLTCTVSGVERIMKPKTVKDKNQKNLTVQVSGVVMDESSDIDPASVIAGTDNGKLKLSVDNTEHCLQRCGGDGCE